ncbi:MAG TPA: glycosyltransferase family 87 protein [Rhizomicrobium sp.]|nr:glycosyltransferase family 87 protein [Rhizomicrobium sp.]
MHFAATMIGILAISLLTRRRPVTQWKFALLAAGCIALALATFLISDPPRYFEDFRIAYYPAGEAVFRDTHALRELTGLGVSGFVNMPVVAYIFAPLALMPMSVAMAIFTLIGLIATILAWKLLADLAQLDLTERWLLALLFAANGPLQYSVKEGNTSHFILLALVAGLALLRAGRPGLAGMVLGAAAIIKPPLLLFGLFFALRRDARGLAAFALVCMAAVAASVALFGWADNLHWLDVCVLQFSHRWLAAFNVQSIPAFLFRFEADPTLLLDWNAYAPPAGLALPAQLLLALLLIAAGVALLKSAALTSQYMVILCLAVLASPLSWSHYYCWLLLPTAFFLRREDVQGGSFRVLGWLAILLVTPLVRPLTFSQSWAVEAYKDTGVSYLLFGGLLWFGLLIWQMTRVARTTTSTIGASKSSAHSWVFRTR